MNKLVKNFLLPFMMISGCVQTEVLFTKPVSCTFQYYQYMDDVNQETKENSKPLSWTFTGISTGNPLYSAGGEEGVFMVHQHETSGGISLFIPQESGADLFSIWPSGLAYWSKHKEFGLIATEQFRGQCSN